MNTTKAKAIAGIVAVFLLGVIVGILSSSIFIGHKIRQFGTGESSFQKIFMKQLIRELDLTEAQQPGAQKIVDEAEIEMHAFFKNSLAAFTNIMEARNAKLKTILTPEQQKKLNAFSERIQKRWPKLHPPPAPPEKKP